MWVFDRIERRKDSLYVTSIDSAATDWEAYRPAALLDGRPLPDLQAQFTGPVVETPDYQIRYAPLDPSRESG